MRNLSIRILASFALCLGFAACGGDDGDDGGDGTQIDAPTNPPIDAPENPPIDAPPTATNALGQVCDLAAPACPTGNTCVAVGGVGSQTMGWCSPQCMNMNSICTTGYTGPAGGMPVCAVTEAQGAPPSLCAIICQAGMDQQCPTGLTCQAVNAQTSICAPPA